MAALYPVTDGKTALAEFQDNDEERKLREHCQRRIVHAEHDQSAHKDFINDCYKLALPWRHLVGEAQAQPRSRINAMYDSTAMTVLEDFAADMLATFTPSGSNWVNIVPTDKLDAGALNQLKGPLQEYTEVLFSEIRSSNLDAALQEAYLDLGPGTMNLVIQDRGSWSPIHCQAWPLSDVLLERDPWGHLGGMWRHKMRMRPEDVPVLWPSAKALQHEDYVHTDQSRPGNYVEVTDGAYRDWSERGTETWVYAVFTPGRMLWHTRLTGEGASPFISARWSRDTQTAWGVGPTYRELPNIKSLNHIRYLVLKSAEKNVDPVTSYENDGVFNLDHGIAPGDWIPREMGSEAPQVIEPKNKFEVAFVTADDLASAIKRAHYQDEPEQIGKTPPTAEQWADQAARKARRMGTPATNLVHDLQYPIIKRFAYLLAKRGVLPKVELNGREIALRPESPLLRAQEMQDVVAVDNSMTLLQKWIGPQQAMLWVKPEVAAHWLFEKTGAPLQIIRTPAEMQAAMAQVAQVMQTTGAMGGGAEGGGEAPAA